MILAFVLAGAFTMAAAVDVLLWKRAGAKNPEQEHDPLLVTVGGAITTFVVAISVVVLLWWAVLNAFRAWRNA